MPDVDKGIKLKTIIYWFRNDLRILDNPGFSQTCLQATHVVPVYVHDINLSEITQWGFIRQTKHRQHFLSTALSGLSELLRQKSSHLIELYGNSTKELIALARKVGATEIHCEKIIAPEEQAIVNQLVAHGIQVVETWQSSMLDFDKLPFEFENLADTFTSFRNQIENKGNVARPVQQAVSLIPPLPRTLNVAPQSSVIDLTTYSPDFFKEYPHAITSFPYHLEEYFGSEKAGCQHIKNYFSKNLAHSYKETRDQLSGTDYSTKFSPWLAIGSISAAMIIESLREYESKNGATKSTYWIWFELLWRDYFRLLHFKYGKKLYIKNGIARDIPQTLRLSGKGLSIQAENLKKWCDGMTGQSLVDAAMHELKATGYLSNRLRQVVASYLIYDLNVDWRAGAAWFESQLVDYDVYSNQGNWLYIAGLGSDPRGGRRFNVQKQTHDHDPQGYYRASWGCA